jgi:hypothetical protein
MAHAAAHGNGPNRLSTLLADPTCQRRLAQFLPCCQLRVHPKSLETSPWHGFWFFSMKGGPPIDPSNFLLQRLTNW